MAKHQETERRQQSMIVVENAAEEEYSDSKLEEEINAEDPYATSAAFFVSPEEEEAEEQQQQRATSQRASEKDLNSPDSNDSGIQVDAHSYGQLTDDGGLYAVVKKPKKAQLQQQLAGERPADESAADVRMNNRATGGDDGMGCPKEQEQMLDDPYATMEDDSPEEEDPLYEVVRNKRTPMRIVEQADDDDERIEHDDNGNLSHINFVDSSDDSKGDSSAEADSSALPEGWQRHEDEKGSYYWHIKSGVTQREPPSPVSKTLSLASIQMRKTSSGDVKVRTKSPVDADTKHRACRQNVFPLDAESSNANRFLVQCLGSVLLAEEELSNDRSGLTINQCIKILSHRTSVIQRGKLQGRDLYLEFVDDRIVLTDVHSGEVISSENIKSVRVWGVGRGEDSRDFAYVSRDPAIGRHVCWVFTCERTGHEVASALRNVCYKILKEDETFAEVSTAAVSTRPSPGGLEFQVSREWQRHQPKWNDSPAIFPVPMNESKKKKVPTATLR